MTRIRRYPRLEEICGLIAVAIACAFVAWGVVTFALSQLRTPVLHVAFASRLTADYAEASTGELAPIEPSVILSVNRDEQSSLAADGKARFVPIFETGTGSQLPGAVRVVASPTPSPQSLETAVSATASPQTTATPTAAGTPQATNTPTGQSTPTPTAIGTPKPTHTPRPDATKTPPGQVGGPPATNTPRPSVTPPGQPATKTPSTQATNTPPGQGGPPATHTPPGQGGQPPTKTPTP